MGNCNKKTSVQVEPSIDRQKASRMISRGTQWSSPDGARHPADMIKALQDEDDSRPAVAVLIDVGTQTEKRTRRNGEKSGKIRKRKKDVPATEDKAPESRKWKPYSEEVVDLSGDPYWVGLAKKAEEHGRQMEREFAAKKAKEDKLKNGNASSKNESFFSKGVSSLFKNKFSLSRDAPEPSKEATPLTMSATSSSANDSAVSNNDTAVSKDDSSASKTNNESSFSLETSSITENASTLPNNDTSVSQDNSSVSDTNNESSLLSVEASSITKNDSTLPNNDTSGSKDNSSVSVTNTESSLLSVEASSITKNDSTISSNDASVPKDASAVSVTKTVSFLPVEVASQPKIASSLSNNAPSAHRYLYYICYGLIEFLIIMLIFIVFAEYSNV